MKTITIINNKGGVGKTTSAQNLGGAFSKFANGKVLLIDIDPQNSLSKGFGIGINTVTKFQIGDVLTDKIPFKDAIQNYDGNLDIIPASLELIIQEQQIANSAKFPFNLKSKLSKIKNDYEIVLIDCPPALSSLTRMALIASDYYIIPTQAEYFSYEGLRALILYTNELSEVNPSMKLGGVFATMYNPNSKNNFNKNIVANLETQLENNFLKTFIRKTTSLSKAQSIGKHIFDFDQNSNGAKDYHALATEIINKMN